MADWTFIPTSRWVCLQKCSVKQGVGKIDIFFKKNFNLRSGAAKVAGDSVEKKLVGKPFGVHSIILSQGVKQGGSLEISCPGRMVLTCETQRQDSSPPSRKTNRETITRILMSKGGSCPFEKDQIKSPGYALFKDLQIDTIQFYGRQIPRS